MVPVRMTVWVSFPRNLRAPPATFSTATSPGRLGEKALPGVVVRKIPWAAIGEAHERAATTSAAVAIWERVV